MQRRCLTTHFILTGVVALGLTMLMIGVNVHAQIVFVSDRDGNGEIYVMDADGDNPQNLTKNGHNQWAPSWSPDGERITFVSDKGRNFEIYVMEADGDNPQNLTKNPHNDIDPAWFRPPLGVAPAGRTLTMWGWLKQGVR